MNPNDYSGPAFPVRQIFGASDHPGMTLRDYFAAKAMQAYLGSYRNGIIPDGLCIDNIAEDAWDMADAMLKIRALDNKGGENEVPQQASLF
jgi:hypothetical protein